MSLAITRKSCGLVTYVGWVLEVLVIDVVIRYLGMSHHDFGFLENLVRFEDFGHCDKSVIWVKRTR